MFASCFFYFLSQTVRGVYETPFSGELLSGEFLAVRILRSDELVDRPLGPVEYETGLPRRASGRDGRGEILLYVSIGRTSAVVEISGISHSLSDIVSRGEQFISEILA